MSAEDFANRHAIDLARVEAGSIYKLRGFLGDLETEIVGKLQGSNIKPNERARFEKMLAGVTKGIAATYSEIKADQKTDLRGIADLAGMTAGRMANAEVGVDMFGTALTENQLSALLKDTLVFGAASGDWWNGQSKALQDKFLRQMRLGYALGEDMDTLSRRVRGTKANNYADGIMAVNRREGDALVRSSIQTISNAARIEGFKQLPDTVKGIKWVATLDTRTTQICIALNGKVWTLPGLKPVGHNKVFPGPVAHWGCRSTQIPVLRTIEELTGKPIRELDDEEFQTALENKLREKGWSEERIAKARGRARASMDGQVSTSDSFDDWLRKQPEDRIRKLLGKERAKLWMDGKITTDDLTDQFNRPLTVEQLKEAIAKGRAPIETEGFPPFDRAKLDLFDDAAAKAAQDAAKREIARVTESAAKADAPLSRALSEVQQAEPSLTPAQTLAKAEEIAVQRVEAEKTAETLSKAREALADGKALTSRQADTVGKLGESARAEFDATVEATKAARTNDTLGEALRLYDDTGHPTGNPATIRATLNKLPEDYRKAVVEVMDGRAAHADAVELVKDWQADPVKARALALVPGENLSPAALIREATVELPAVIAETLAPLAKGSTVENRVIRELTGMDAPTEPSLRRWFETTGTDPLVFLTLYGSLVQARKDREAAAEALVSLKADLVAGKAPTKAQRDILDDMTPAERRAFDEAVADAKKARG